MVDIMRMKQYCTRIMKYLNNSVRTTKSLLECKRFYSEADAQETADKHGFVVRKVIVKVECE